KTVIIGAVHEREIYEVLKEKAGNNNSIIFVTEDEYTKNARELLGLADLYIGSGRSLMEASFLGLPIAAHVTNGRLPVLIDEGNYEEFLKTNFSGRSYSNIVDEERLNNIRKLVLNTNNYKKYATF